MRIKTRRVAAALMPVNFYGLSSASFRGRQSTGRIRRGPADQPVLHAVPDRARNREWVDDFMLTQSAHRAQGFCQRRPASDYHSCMASTPLSSSKVADTSCVDEQSATNHTEIFRLASSSPPIRK